MRIAIFSDNFYPELSGIADSIIVLSKELARRGHTVHFYAPRYAHKDYFKMQHPSAEDPDLGKNITFTRFSSMPYPTGTGQARLVVPTGLRWLSIKKHQYDLIHTQMFFGVGLEALAAAKGLKIPLVGTNHTAIREFLRYSPIHSSWIDRKILSYVNWYYEKCVLTTAPSESVLKEMRGYGFKGEARVVSNPIDHQMFHPLPEGDRERLKKKFGFNDTTVIHAGRLSEERNIDVMIRAMPQVVKKVPEAMLALAGHGSDQEKLRKLSVSLGVERSVVFIGTLTKPDLNEAYNAAELFVITSTSDTQSMVMMQAMSAGLPIIAVRARAFPEYVNEKNGMLVRPGDPDDVARSMIHMLSNRSERIRLGNSARESVQKFSPEAVADVWEDIYSEVVRSVKSSRR